jgi:hypothetical protein
VRNKKKRAALVVRARGKHAKKMVSMVRKGMCFTSCAVRVVQFLFIKIRN